MMTNLLVVKLFGRIIMVKR